MPRRSNAKRIKQPLKDDSLLSSSSRPPVRRSSCLAVSTSGGHGGSASSSVAAIASPVDTPEPVEAIRKRRRDADEEEGKDLSTSSSGQQAPTEGETSRVDGQKEVDRKNGSDEGDKALPLLKRRKVASTSPSPSTPSSSTLSTDIFSAAAPPPYPPTVKVPYVSAKPPRTQHRSQVATVILPHSLHLFPHLFPTFSPLSISIFPSSTEGMARPLNGQSATGRPVNEGE